MRRPAAGQAPLDTEPNRTHRGGGARALAALQGYDAMPGRHGAGDYGGALGRARPMSDVFKGHAAENSDPS